MGREEFEHLGEAAGGGNKASKTRSISKAGCVSDKLTSPQTAVRERLAWAAYVIPFAVFFPAVAVWHLANVLAWGIFTILFGEPFDTRTVRGRIGERVAFIPGLVPIALGGAAAVAEIYLIASHLFS